MNIENFVNSLLPGDTERHISCFSELCGGLLNRRYSDLVIDLENALQAFSAQRTDQERAESEADAFTVYLKTKAPMLYEQFIETILGLYLSQPEVISGLDECAEPLFPRGQSLPAINFDLLEPVVESPYTARSRKTGKEP